MKVLLWLDPGAGSVGGAVVQGHIIQAQRTADGLRTLGVDVLVNSDEHLDVSMFDVVHSLGMPRRALRRARQERVPVAISTIYWSRRYVLGIDRQASPGRHAWASASHRTRVAASVFRRGGPTVAQRILEPVQERALTFEAADLLLPNSAAEAAAVVEELTLTTPAHVVPNGVDPDVFYPPAQTRTRDYVLFVGRFEPHKNQLNLIRALSRSGYPLVLVGPAHPEHLDYYAACVQAAGPSVSFEQARGHDALRALYQGARVHVLPSWFETTGLVSLEAALCGCRVATTERGFAREYFGEYADYLDPSSPASILTAVTSAWDRPATDDLRRHVLDRYTWSHVARATKEGYSLLLA